MKAKDYYKKYRDEIVSKDEKKSIEAISSMVLEMSKEARDTIKDRRVRSDSGAVAVIREMNQKYNAVVTLLRRSSGLRRCCEMGSENIGRSRSRSSSGSCELFFWPEFTDW